MKGPTRLRARYVFPSFARLFASGSSVRPVFSRRHCTQPDPYLNRFPPVIPLLLAARAAAIHDTAHSFFWGLDAASSESARFECGAAGSCDDKIRCGVTGMAFDATASANKSAIASDVERGVGAG